MSEDEENQRPSQEVTELSLGAELDAYEDLYDVAHQLQVQRGLTTAQLLGLVHLLAADLAQQLTSATARHKRPIRTQPDIDQG